MFLSSSILNFFYFFLSDLLQTINEHVESKKYVVILLRIKKFSNKVSKKTWIICDRDRKSRLSIDRQRRHISFKQVDCLFKIIVIVELDTMKSWYLNIIIDTHNHDFTKAAAHSILHRMIISETRHDITRKLIIQIASFQILSVIWYDNLID